MDISYQDLDTGNFPMIASFRTDSIEFYHNLNFHNGVITTARNLFAGLTHTRQDTPINRGYYDYRVKNGVGVITSHYESLSFTTYKHSSVTTKTESGKTYYARTSLTSASSIYRFTNNISCGGDVSRVYVSFYANSYGKAYVYLGYTDSGGQLYYGPLLATPWNSEVSYTGTVDLPSNAVSWCLMCQPDTGYSSYWCGIRSVSMRNYSQDATAAIEVSDMGGEITGRLDAFGSWGEAVGGLRMTKGSSTSSILELGSGEMWFNGKPILEWLQNLDDRISALEY